MRFGNWNIQGMKNKVTEILEGIAEQNLDIVILTETKIKGQGKLADYIHFWSGVNKNQRAQAGVSLPVRRKTKKLHKGL